MKSLIVFLLSTQFIYADILMLNFNGNGSTIAAAKIAAKKRGEKVIVIPKAGEKIDALTLDDKMSELSQKGVDVSSIIFSGHDGGGYFSGKSGGMSKSDVSEVMSKYPEMADGVKSLILRGCYTATPGEAMSLENESWNGIFPKLNMIAGYIGAAPSSERKYSKAFIQEILELESKIYLEDSVKNVEKMFANISHSKWTSNSLAFRSCGDNEYKYVARTFQNKGVGALSQTQINEMCNQDKIEEHLSLVKKYMNAGVGYESPPLEHRGTKLRAAYTYLNGVTHCQDFLPGFSLYPTLQQIIKLIYFDYIKSNFLHHYGDMFNNATLAIKEYNKKMNPDLPLIDLNTASRAEILKFIHGLHSIVPADILDKDKYTYSYEKRDDPNFKDLIKIRSIASETLQYMTEYAVPFDWVSSKKSPEKGSFIPFNDPTLGRMQLLDKTELKDVKHLHYTDAVSYYFKNHDNQQKKEEAQKVVFSVINKNFVGDLEPIQLQKAKNFIKDQAKVYPEKIIKTAIRNPQIVSEEALNTAVSELKAKNYKISKEDYSFFQNSFIIFEDASKRQKKNYEKIFKDLSAPEDADKIDILTTLKTINDGNKSGLGGLLVGFGSSSGRSLNESAGFSRDSDSSTAQGLTSGQNSSGNNDGN